MLTCPAPSAESPLLPALVAYVDCQASALGENGFLALAGGYLLPALLAGALTIYVALYGYRLLFGQQLGAKEAVWAVLRIALVVTFCTRWPSYEAVVYRVVVQGPGELAAALLQPAGLSVASVEEIAARLQDAYETVQTAGLQQARPATPAPTAPSLSQPSTASGAGMPQPAPQQGALSGSGVGFVMSSLGPILAVRLTAGVLLAIGPLIISLALFDSCLGFFEGWVRALAAASLATMACMILSAIELSFIRSELAGATPTGLTPLAGQGLLMTTVIFAFCWTAFLLASAALALGFRLPRPPNVIANTSPVRLEGVGARPDRRSTLTRRAGASEAPSRAQALADSVSLQGLRERTKSQPSLIASRVMSVGSVAKMGIAPTEVGRPAALGYTLRREVNPRRAANLRQRMARDE